LFNLEELIPASHLLRRINPVVTRVLAELRENLTPFYSDIGRPSIDPELMLRMLIVGYCYGIRFERRLCEEVELHLAYRWFCRLDLDDQVPDHSTFSVNRHGRFRNSAIFRKLFEAVVRACMSAGLVKGEGFAVDASVMEADASRYHGQAPGETDWSAPERQTRAVAEFLSSLDDEGSDADRKLPKVISPTDPCSAWTAKANKRVQFGYGLNYMIDLEHAVIVDVEATPARTYDEVAATRTMIDRTEMAFGLKPARLTADTAYGTGKLLAWLLDRDITPHIPVWDRYQRTDGMFSHLDFTYDNARDVYICPNGRSLGTSGTVHDGRVRNYLSRPADCRVCNLKERCTRAPFRKIARDINEAARNHARLLKGSLEFEQSSHERKKVEMRFAHLKVHHRFERMRLRGLTGARDEFHLAAIVQNLKTLASHIWRPSLSEPAACS
jgi:transposase